MSAPRSAAGRIARALLWCLALLLVLLGWATVSRSISGGGPEVERVGTASVHECTEYGPVSRYGLGTTYRCTADVRWSDGDTERLAFPPGQLRPGDAGSPVPVYLDVAEGLREESSLGRNDSARFAALELPVTIAFGFAAVAAGIGALHAGYRVFRPRARSGRSGEGRSGEGRSGGAPRAPARSTSPIEQRRTHQRVAAAWPLDDEDREAAPVPRLVLRLRLLGAWCGLVALAVPLATVPRFDAPRARDFVSPWPQIERALLVDPPATAVVIVGLALAALLLTMAGAARRDAARLFRYGPAYLARDDSGKGSSEKKAGARLRQAEATRRRDRLTGLAAGLSFIALAAWAAAWAAVRAAGVVPSAAPPAVWLAAASQAGLLALLAVVWLATTETRHRRLELLLARFRDTDLTASGTVGGSATS
ncbi:DUF6346 domain-containing protein [Qaidamihabitans albus]|uniref:DUF6346 domain-containing protein n=1 Tax=Qaidamihabitans albus TaxID=2795733 RepID=UPI0018F26559|nr:DUF6346 domain-containing protein [Qaidamihabitans albus]